jgi:hypothetical protein
MTQHFPDTQEASQSITAAVQFKIECHRFRALQRQFMRDSQFRDLVQ